MRWIMDVEMANIPGTHRPDGMPIGTDGELRQRLLRYCRSLLGSSELAQDVVQDVCCTALTVTTEPRHPRAWLYRVARNRCLNLLRRKKRAGTVLPLCQDPPNNDTSLVSRLANRELRSRLGFLLENLPANYREPLQLRYIEGLTRNEIASVLNLTESVVKSRLFEGLKKLRHHTSLMRY